MTRTDRADVQWCPTAEDIFLTWGTKLQLYQTREIVQQKKFVPRAGEFTTLFARYFHYSKPSLESCAITFKDIFTVLFFFAYSSNEAILI